MLLSLRRAPRFGPTENLPGLVRVKRWLAKGNACKAMKDNTHQTGKRNSPIRMMERSFFILGIVLLGLYVASDVTAEISSRAALRDFKSAQTANQSSTETAERAPSKDGVRTSESVDTSRWSGNRIQSYLGSLRAKKESAIGVLKIPRLHLEVPIFEGTDGLTLNRGVGHIVGTAALGGSGNAGIAGHRDGFFRSLKDIAIGDEIELLSAVRVLHYEVQKIEVVTPSQTEVLADRGNPTLTLVTCFPFYFDGNAPERFIVWARPAISIGQLVPAIPTSN